MFGGPQWREAAWSRLAGPWDVIVVGGGVVGAGVAREAARRGLRVALVEARDFAWGTSSRSSQLVHGGLRYLRQGRWRLVRDGARERERLIRDAPGLVEPVGFLFSERRGVPPGRWLNRAALVIYDRLAGRSTSRYLSAEQVLTLAPHLAPAGLIGGHSYGEARTDDARLVLRVLSEAIGHGAVALNHATADGLLWRDERVAGIRLRDTLDGRTTEVRGQVVVSATGVWADHFGRETGAAERMRPVRGSHLVFPLGRLPVDRVIAFPHPHDRRPVNVTPWEGVAVIGTTDADYDGLLDHELAVTSEEVAYLLAAANAEFPGLALTADDIISTWSGLRPMIDEGDVASSAAAREHAMWAERGLVTIAGGKLTTFRLMALHALAAVGAQLPVPPPPDDRVVDEVEPPALSGEAATALDEVARRRLTGRYGARAADLLAAAQPGDLDLVPGTPYRWAELRWGARAEGVAHLDDLLLRRVRLGLLLPDGGAALLPHIRTRCQGELGWDDERWAREEERYLALRRAAHGVPESALIRL